MARNYGGRKMSAKKILSIVLGAVILLGTLGGAALLFGSETREIPSSAFSVGGLDDSGEYVEQVNTIFTEDLIECQGLEITPDVKNTSTYVVYLYDADKQFIESSGSLSRSYKLTRTDVRYCRVMIVPEKSLEEDFEIKFWDVWDYANDINIKVNRKQHFEMKNYFEEDKLDKVASYDSETNTLTYIAKEGFGASKIMSVEDASTLRVELESAQPEKLQLIFYTEGVVEDEIVYTYVSTLETTTESTVQEITVPEGATHMVVNYDLTEDFAIYREN